jgi:hypothetical protein
MELAQALCPFGVWVTNLSMKHGSLFCFVLFYFLCHAKISHTIVLHVTLLVSLQNSQWIEVHWVGLRLFGTMMWKLLIIELLFEWKLNIIETKKFIRIWKHSWCYWKGFGKLDLIDFISQFSKLRCGRYWFLSGFCCYKNWLCKEKSVDPLMCSHLDQWHMLH